MSGEPEKNLGPKDLALGCFLRGLSTNYPFGVISRSDGAMKNIKFQAPNLRVSGVRCQGRKTKILKPEH
jgi:hypothetical protein